MATHKDVAKLAGVSFSAVSKTFNGYDDISMETKEKIFAAAKALNYAPNAVAKRLSLKQSRTIGLLLPKFGRYDGKDGLIYQVMSGVQQAADDAGYETITVTGSSARQVQDNFIAFCSDYKLAGMVFYSLSIHDFCLPKLKAAPFPFVGIDMDACGGNFSSVGADNTAAARDAVSYLIERGYRNIAMINGTGGEVVSETRLQGYRQALTGSGRVFHPENVIDCGFHEQQAYLDAGWLRADGNDFDAVFCASDLMAIGVIRRLREMGLRVPDDIAVMGFDDIALAEYVTPALSTIRQDLYSSGACAVSTLIDMVENNAPGSKKYIEHSLVIRSSA